MSNKPLDTTNLWLKPNQNCWFSTETPLEPYNKAILLTFDLKSNKARINIKPLEKEAIIDISIDNLLERCSNEQLYEDLVNIECLNEAELLTNLRSRFMNNEDIFTYVGPTLLIINPYKQMSETFSIQNLALYQKEVHNTGFTLKDFKPHIYAISADTFKKLFENQQNQAIVISGESGAGKTENVKYAMRFLTSLGNITESEKVNLAEDLFKKSQSIHKRLSIKKEAIEEKILGCNPILEAFGNAKTVRNDNSSRFGKYVALLVNKENRKIIGARLVNYLLEKSRIVQQAKDERNYHIFYHLLNGADDSLLKDLCLMKENTRRNSLDFNYLSHSGCFKVEKMDDKFLFSELEEAFQVIINIMIKTLYI